jgi:hypothetical protein
MKQFGEHVVWSLCFLPLFPKLTRTLLGFPFLDSHYLRSDFIMSSRGRCADGLEKNLLRRPWKGLGWLGLMETDRQSEPFRTVVTIWG